MTRPLDRGTAARRAAAALVAWGETDRPVVQVLPVVGGWRVRPAAGAPRLGGSHAVVRAADGVVLRVPAGATDAFAAAALAAAPPI